MLRKSLASMLAVGAAFIVFPGVANAVQSAGQQTSQAINDVPRCARPIGTLAVNEPQNQWWVQYRLGSPEALIKVFYLPTLNIQMPCSPLVRT